MLSDRDRTLLAPHLALLRAAQKELAAAQRVFDDAQRQAAESTVGTDWRDRMLGGLFSVDEGRAKRFRQGRGARKDADKALAVAKARYDKYAERVDGLLQPMLAREDPAFRRTLAAVHACDKAIHACEEMRFRLGSALARPVRDARDAKGDRDGETWHEVEIGRRRFDELVAGLRTAIPALAHTIDRAALAVVEVTGGPTPDRIHLDVVTVSGPAAERRLRDLRRQLDTATKEITRWRTRADESRTATLRAAGDAL